jgi:hypothetical protein
MRRAEPTRATPRQTVLRLARWLWPVALVLVILWFPFDWLATVWPAFGAVFYVFFRDEHDHFIGHTVFYLLVGLIVLGYLPVLRRKPHWYALGLVLVALVQETIQAIFRGELPTFNDFNAFRGDALGGLAAFTIAWLFTLIVAYWPRRNAPSPPS